MAAVGSLPAGAFPVEGFLSAIPSVSIRPRPDGHRVDPAGLPWSVTDAQTIPAGPLRMSRTRPASRHSAPCAKLLELTFRRTVAAVNGIMGFGP